MYSPKEQSPDAQGTAFTASWTPSKAAALDVNNLPLKKTHRAWERKPTYSVGENGKVKTVWKRYRLRSQPIVIPEDNGKEGGSVPADKSPGRIVKKARVGSPVKAENNGAVEGQGRRKSSATRYERRKSGYRRKHIALPAIETSDEDTMAVIKALAKSTTVPEDTLKGQVMEQLDETHHVQDGPISQHEEDSMCDLAEAQLLGEAGLEPIPADFTISPVKKPPRLARRDIRSVNKQPSMLLAIGSLDTAALTVGEAKAVNSDAVQYPSLLNAESPRKPGASEEDSASVGDSDEREAPVNDADVPSMDDEQLVSKKPAQSMSYPSIDIFGLDDNDVDSLPEAQQHDSMEVGEDTPNQTGETFSISLNDETVNLGALLAKNDNLSATITDDSIQLAVTESDDAEDEDLTPTTDIITEQKEGESPVDSPDELLMDLDATDTVTTTGLEGFTHLEDDKAKLSSFLRRVAAAKEKKSANVTRRESLQNRRDSDVVRKALASPRQVLEEKDKNLSPQRSSQQQAESTLSLDEILASPLVKPASRTAQPMTDERELDELASGEQTGSPRRRSSRSTRSKLPQFSSPSTGLAPNKISVRTDGGEKVNLNRTEAQQLADLVRRNTKKNKGTAIPAPKRLVKLKLEALATVVDGETPVVEKLLTQGVKHVTWRERLAEYATSTATADLEAATPTPSEEGAVKAEPKKQLGSGTPRMRRLRGLGAANGTPAKKVLQSFPLPEVLEEEKQQRTIAATSANAKKKRSVAALTVAPTSNSEPASTTLAPAAEDEKMATQKKSKLPSPKKLTLNPSLTSIGGIGSGLPVSQGKENANLLFTGLSSPAKKMSKIPAPASLEITNGLRPPIKRVRSGVGKKA